MRYEKRKASNKNDMCPLEGSKITTICYFVDLAGHHNTWMIY